MLVLLWNVFREELLGGNVASPVSIFCTCSAPAAFLHLCEPIISFKIVFVSSERASVEESSCTVPCQLKCTIDVVDLIFFFFYMFLFLNVSN